MDGEWEFDVIYDGMMDWTGSRDFSLHCCIVCHNVRLVSAPGCYREALESVDFQWYWADDCKSISNGMSIFYI